MPSKTNEVWFDLRGMLAIMDDIHSHLFYARASKFNRRYKRTEYFNEGFYLPLSQNRIGVGFGAISILQKTMPHVKFRVKNIISSSPISKIEIPDFPSMPYRWYQKEALDRIAVNRMGSIEIPTGGGKSLIILGAASGLASQRNVLIIVPTLANKSELQVLARNLSIDLKDYADVREQWVGMSGNLYISSSRSVCNDLESGSNMNVLQSIGSMILDEGHHLSASSWHRIMISLPNLSRVYGFSGTIVDGRRNFSNFDQIQIEDALIYSGTGDILYSVSTNQIPEFIDSPILIEVPYTWPASYKYLENTNSWVQYSKALSKNLHRTKFIAQIIQHMNDLGRTSITPVDRKLTGKEILMETGLGNIICWYGNEEIFDNHENPLTYEEAMQKVNDGEIRHIIATSHFNESVNLPNISTCILGSGKKGRVANQRSGRIARIGPIKSAVINVRDNIGILSGHSKSRSRSIKKYFKVKSHQVDSIKLIGSMLSKVS